MISAIILALLALAGCEDTTPVKEPVKVEKPATKTEKEKLPPVDKAIRAKNVETAALITLAGQAGGLHRCRETGLYQPNPDTVEDTYYRLRARFVTIRDSDDPLGADIAMMAYINYAQALQQGTVDLLTVPDSDNPQAGFTITTLPVQFPLCASFESAINKAREKGGLLDVAPQYGKDGLKNRT